MISYLHIWYHILNLGAHLDAVVLRLSEEKNFPNLMQDAARLFEIPTLCLSRPLKKIGFQELGQYYWNALEPLQVWCHPVTTDQAKASPENIPFESSQVHLDNTVTGILDRCQPESADAIASWTKLTYNIISYIEIGINVRISRPTVASSSSCCK